MQSPNRWRVMVVDDDKDIRTIIEAALEDAYEVVHAHDGLDALDKIETYEPDLVIMDVAMPLMSGFEATEAIRKMPRYAATQILFLSAHDSRENMAKSYQAGGNIFLTKPIDPERLRKNVDLYFRTDPPPRRVKRMSYHQIQIIEGRKAPKPRPAAPAHADAGANLGAGRNPRVLLVEDDKDMTEILEMGLSDHFEVTAAHDGMSAIEKLVRYQPDLLVVDIMLPKMNGYQFCQSVRHNKTYARTPIVVVTAKASAKDRQYALRCGANAFVAKPFNVEELVSVCVGIVSAPDFQIRRKNLSLSQIKTLEGDALRSRQHRLNRLDRPGRPPE